MSWAGEAESLLLSSPAKGWVDYVFKRPASIEIDTSVPRAGDEDK